MTVTYVGSRMMASSLAMALPKLAGSLALRSPSSTPLLPVSLKVLSVDVEVVGYSSWRWQELQELVVLRIQSSVLVWSVLSEPLSVDFWVLGYSCR